MFDTTNPPAMRRLDREGEENYKMGSRTTLVVGKGVTTLTESDLKKEIEDKNKKKFALARN